ncbi:hypothetical protein CORC01_00409 [Colletotrichum orchidophilum]|uniref:Heterokaryon incompatibility domain-containing protein n=1 Tax=Colletotrichum orchidophilum TaxID=1209926 RepID=A0A1G4BRR6_9PEZI|nr:uncharacterized protein CORC01_00409 [Colletotrichum orchidophilum]OHF04070.1 hypothetical protein CORC01_00409 [Colletotrichum orchidophilum]
MARSEFHEGESSTAQLKGKIHDLREAQERTRPEREKLSNLAKNDLKEAKQLARDSAKQIEDMREEDLASLGRSIKRHLEDAIDALDRTLTQLDNASHVQTSTDNGDTAQKLDIRLRALELEKHEREKTLADMRAARREIEEEIAKWSDSDQSDNSMSANEAEESEFESHVDGGGIQLPEEGHASETAAQNMLTHDTNGAAKRETQPANEAESPCAMSSVRESWSDDPGKNSDDSNKSELEGYEGHEEEHAVQIQGNPAEGKQEGGKQEGGKQEEGKQEEGKQEGKQEEGKQEEAQQQESKQQETESEEEDEEENDDKKKMSEEDVKGWERDKRHSIRMQMMYKGIEIGESGETIKVLKRKIARLKRKSNRSNKRKIDDESDAEEDLDLEEMRAEKENKQELSEYDRLSKRKQALGALQVEKAALEVNYSGASSGERADLPRIAMRMLHRMRRSEELRGNRDRKWMMVLDMMVHLHSLDHGDAPRSNSDTSDDDDEADDTAKTVNQKFLELQGEMIKKTQTLENLIERILERLLGHRQIFDLSKVLRKEMDLEHKWLAHLENSGKLDTAEDSLIYGKHGHLFTDNRDEVQNMYTELKGDQFRVFILIPAPAAYYPIICKMETWSTASLSPSAGGRGKEYAALSYFWDSETYNGRLYFVHPDHDASVKESEWGSTARNAAQVRIRNNLYRALLRLRRCGRDAQPSKTEQLSRMVEIYSGASNVCIWLGESDNEGRSDEAMQFISTIMDFALLDRHAHDAKQARKWYALSELMRDRWFSQRWVVQEIALAKHATVHCGGRKVQWSDFADAASLLISNQETVSSLFDDHSEWREGRKTIGDVSTFGAAILLEATNNLFRRKPDGDIKKPIKTIEYLATSLKTFDTGDPRDLIYSLVSIASDTAGELWSPESESSAPTLVLEVDYQKPQVVVFKDFTKFCVDISKSLDIICRPWAMPITGSKSDSLPSWIPLLENSEFGTPEEVYSGRKNGDGLVGPAGSPNYQASGQLVCRVEFKLGGDSSQTSESHMDTGVNDTTAEQDSDLGLVDTDDVLLAKGLKLAEITAVSPRNTGGVIHRESLQMGGWEGFKRDTNSVPDRIWRTLVADRDQNGHIPPSWYQRACLRCLEIADTFNNGDLNVSELLMGKSEMLQKYLSRVRNVTWNRRFFTTELPDSETLRERNGEEIEETLSAGFPVVATTRDISESGDAESTRSREGNEQEVEENMHQQGIEEARQLGIVGTKLSVLPAHHPVRLVHAALRDDEVRERNLTLKVSHDSTASPGFPITSTAISDRELPDKHRVVLLNDLNVCCPSVDHMDLDFGGAMLSQTGAITTTNSFTVSEAEPFGATVLVLSGEPAGVTQLPKNPEQFMHH